MVMSTAYARPEPARTEVDASTGPMLLEFGTPWCGYCRAAQALIAEAFDEHPEVPHVKIEDGPGRRLGRSFGVKLWPTLIFLRDGRELLRLVRPRDARAIADAIATIAASG